MSVEFQDYYETLGVTRAATTQEIQKAYRKLARKYHPDVSKEKGAEEHFKRVTEAYEVLKNPESRKKYDALGANFKGGEPFTPPPGAGWQNIHFDFGNMGGQSSGFSSFFDAIFGSNLGTRPQSPFQSETSVHQEAQIEISLHDAAFGVEREITLRPASGSKRQASKTIRVKIPKGTTEGTKLRLKGQGSSTHPKGQPGDLILTVHIAEHPVFKLEGHDLIETLKITPWEAALGGSVEVPTLASPLKMRVPPGTSSGTRMRLKGKGLPFPDGRVGDLKVDIQIVVPKSLSPEEQKLFEALASASQFKPRAD